uniref:Uncharacterized protein n=1 Tax=Parascaris univalens TaxID=6257 RepID=A0A915BAK0_PARUN
FYCYHSSRTAICCTGSSFQQRVFEGIFRAVDAMHRVVAFFAAFIAIALIDEPIFGADTKMGPAIPNIPSNRRVKGAMNVSNMSKWGKVPPKANSHENIQSKGQNTKALQPVNVFPTRIRVPHNGTFSGKRPTVNRNDSAKSNSKIANVGSERKPKDPMRHVGTLGVIKSTTDGKRDELAATSKRSHEGSVATNTSSHLLNVTALTTVSSKLTTTTTSFKSTNAATLSGLSQLQQKTATEIAKGNIEGMKRNTTNALKTTKRASGGKKGPSKYSQKTKEKGAASETHMPKSVSVVVAASNTSTLPLISSSTMKSFEITASPLRLLPKLSTIGRYIIRANTTSPKKTAVLTKTSPRLTVKVELDREVELTLSQTNTTTKEELTPSQTNTTTTSTTQTTQRLTLSTKIKQMPPKPQLIPLSLPKSTSRGIKTSRTTTSTTTTTATTTTTTTTTTKAIIRTTTSAAVTSTTIVETTITTTSVGATTSATDTGPSTSISTTVGASTSITTTKATALKRSTRHPVFRSTKKPKKSMIIKMPPPESSEEAKKGDPDKSGGRGALITGIVIGMVIIVAVVFAGLFIMFQMKRRQAEQQQQHQQGQPANTDGNSDYGTINSVLNDPKSNMMESEWAPDKIKASQFTYKGPLQIPFKQPLVLKHELEDEAPASQHESQHVQFDDALNEVHEMGSEVEVIVFGGRQKKATKTGKASTRYKHVPPRVDTKEKQAQIAIREP